MFHKVVTLTDFIIKEEHQYHNTTGQLTLLLTHLENCAKIIASHIKRTGLIDIIGYTGETNTYGDSVKKLDEYANQLLTDTLINSGLVSMVGSEELKEPLTAKNEGKYAVFLDPIDGSSNIDSNINVGTIFSIYKNESNSLQPGRKQIAAGYILYGTSVMFVFTSGQGVNGFTLDPSIGSFLLSHPNIKMPKMNSLYATNEGYFNKWNTSLQKYIQYIKTEKTITKKPYKLRYIGAMISDIHRILLEGGIFLYEKDSENLNGKLRLMYEVNPVSFLIEQAGGSATSNNENPLDIVPSSHDQQAPFVCGSEDNVKEYLDITKEV